MIEPQCTAVGTVTDVTQVTPNNGGKPYTSVKIEMAPEERTGKGYKQRVNIRVAGENPSRCVKGAIISISGPLTASTHEWKGKHYAQLTIYGRPQVVIDAPNEQSYENARVPRESTAAEGRPARPTAISQPPAAPEEDDVPF